ncbi:MAG: hypothetical protein HY828_05785 [Actinobacteria bacterium]|nr:hypothetical protein [Actinomycetota bacterium]
MSDYRDPELEQMLGRLSGAYPDANTALVAVTGRVRQVKRRRAFVASTAACAVLFGVGALAVRGGDADQNVQPASESSSESSNATVTSVSTSVDDASTSSSDESTSSVDETSSSVEPVSSASVAGGSGSPSSNKGSSTSSSSGSGNSSGSSHSTVTVPNGQTTHSSAGGSIVVAVTNGDLSLVSDAPADGFTTEVKHDRADRVEVEFSDGSTTWRIRVDLVDGSPVVEISQD